MMNAILADLADPKLHSDDTQRLFRDTTRLKILLLRIRILHPLNVGGKIRTAKMIEELSKRHDVTIVSYRFPDESDTDVEATARCCRRLVTVPLKETAKFSPAFFWELAQNLFDPRPYMIAKYATNAMARKVAEVYAEEQPDLIICDFPHTCEGLRFLGNVPYLLFQHNYEPAIFEQLAKRAKNPLSRAYIGLQARKMRRYDANACRKALRIIAVSDVDRDAYERAYGVAHCDVIPTGVDTEYFRPWRGEARPNSLVFTGSMDWLANQDAMLYFTEEIWPRLRAEIPDIQFTIVGRTPPPEIRKLGELPGIMVTGTVPDIRPFVQQAQVYIVPLRIGSGTRLKLVEAMGMGKAIVSTSIGAEGLPVTHDENIILADDPDAFCQAILNLLRDPQRRTELGCQARQLVEDQCSWSYVGHLFNLICTRAARVTALASSRNGKSQ